MRLVWLVWSLRAQGEGPTERGKPLAIFSPHQPRRTKGLPSPLAVYFSSSLLDKIPYFTFPNPCEWLHILVRMHSFQKERVDDWYWSRRVSRARGSILDRHYVIYVKTTKHQGWVLLYKLPSIGSTINIHRICQTLIALPNFNRLTWKLTAVSAAIGSSICNFSSFGNELVVSQNKIPCSIQHLGYEAISTDLRSLSQKFVGT